MSSSPCFLCPNPSVSQCEVCCQVNFCSSHASSHQKDGYCFPYTVSHQEGVGRVIQASRDILPGEVIIREAELVVGPAKTTAPVCLGCLRRVNGSVRCGGCGWPICQQDCAGMGVWHTREECKLIGPSAEGIVDCGPQAANCGAYQAIMPLRVLLLKEENREAYDYIMQFMDHKEDRGWEVEEVEVISRIREEWGLAERYSREEVMRVEGILDVNTVEHKVEDHPSSRAFLPITSLCSHSCINNTVKCHEEEGIVITRAKVNIEKGEELYHHYGGGLRGRLQRRPMLHEGWYFWCSCPRCRSPDEAGAEMSTLRCWRDGPGQTQCGGDGVDVGDVVCGGEGVDVGGGPGDVVCGGDVGDGPGDVVCGGDVRPVEPLQPESAYSCEVCGQEYTKDEVLQVENIVKDDLEKCYTTDAEALKKVLDSAVRLHPCHYLMLILKWLLITCWGRAKGRSNQELREEELEEKIRYCAEYMSALDIVDPGISHNRGVTLWELHSASSFLLNKRFQEERLAPVKFVEGLKESLVIVTEAARVLRFNPENTLEGKLFIMAAQSEIKLKEMISFFAGMFKV